MTVGRRRSILTLAFLGLMLGVTGDRSSAQPPEPSAREVWGKNLTPDELKNALLRFGKSKGEADTGLLEQMIGDYLRQNVPGVDPDDPRLKQAIKQFLGDKQQMEKLKQIAKQKAEEKAGGQPGGGKITPEDIGKLFKQMPEEKRPEWLKPPEGPPAKIPPPETQPNGPKQPNPKFPELKTKPENPNPPAPPVPMPEHHEEPKPNQPGKIEDFADHLHLPEENPFGRPDEPTDPRAKSMSALAALWERNIGPLNDSPEIKRALFDLVAGDNGFDFDIKDGHGNSFWDALKNGPGNENSGFGDLFKEGGDGNGGGWDLPKFDMPSLGWGKWFDGSSHPPGGGGSGSSLPEFQRPEAPSGWSLGGGGSGLGGIGAISGTFLTLLLLALVVLGAFFLWWFYRDTSSAAAGVLNNGLGDWPIDPHAINSREDVVKAFEYLSVLICGPEAKMWTHSTIADALTELAVTQGEVAVKLARLYELARYAPLDEPLTRSEIIEARVIVCELAGVS